MFSVGARRGAQFKGLSGSTPREGGRRDSWGEECSVGPGEQWDPDGVLPGVVVARLSALPSQP